MQSASIAFFASSATLLALYYNGHHRPVQPSRSYIAAVVTIALLSYLTAGIQIAICARHASIAVAVSGAALRALAELADFEIVRGWQPRGPALWLVRGMGPFSVFVLFAPFLFGGAR